MKNTIHKFHALYNNYKFTIFQQQYLSNESQVISLTFTDNMILLNPKIKVGDILVSGPLH